MKISKLNFKQTILEKPAFKIYKFEFTCDKCGDSTIMGLIGQKGKYEKICDICLIEDEEEEDEIANEKGTNRQNPHQ